MSCAETLIVKMRNEMCKNTKSKNTKMRFAEMRKGNILQIRKSESSKICSQKTASPSNKGWRSRFI
ncbi:hypothetical protein BK125_18185 [Paenibacillus odorifer]|uniref:Uncharacterized protein n=1 Tax=Paenibacillus odorifer TaxID=189426 RepID=A0ABX3GZH3_9BACL|nr:hypothetical protein BK125_18185 [Paenibacillus odorifer]OMD39338.1 hypothetical protein BSO21_02655 [Paenibacillus odorifer]